MIDLLPLVPSHLRTSSLRRQEQSELVSLLSTRRANLENLSHQWLLLLFLQLLLASLEVRERVLRHPSPLHLLDRLLLRLQIFSSELNLRLSTTTTLADLRTSRLPVPTLSALNLQTSQLLPRQLDSQVPSRTSNTFDHNLRWIPRFRKPDPNDLLLDTLIHPRHVPSPN